MMRILLYLTFFLYSFGLSAQITLTSKPSCQGIGSGSILVEAIEDPTVVWDDVVTISCKGVDNDFFYQEETDGSTGILNYTIHSVPPGLYEVEIFFSSTCDATGEITVGESQATLSYNPSVTGIHQGVIFSGSIILNDFLYLDQDGSIPMQAPTFEWRDPLGFIVGTSQNLRTISYPGMYCVTITSDLCEPHKECFYVGSCDDNMIEPSASYVIDPDCYDGLFDFTVPLINTADRVPPFIVEWDDGYIGRSRWNLAPGTFSVTVSDQSGCSSTGHFDIQYNAPPIDGQIISNKDFVSCDNDASLIYETNVGTISDYTYLWSNGSTDHEISNLGEGIYTLQVENSSGCVRDFSYEIRNLDETISIDKIEHIWLCLSNDDGSVIFNNNTERDLYLYLTRIDIGVGYPMGSFSGSQFSVQNLPSGEYRYALYNLDSEGERGNCLIKSGIFELCCCNNNGENPEAYQCQNTLGYPPEPKVEEWNYIVTPDLSGNPDGAIVFNFDGINLPPDFTVHAEHRPSESTYESPIGDFQNLPSGWYDLHFDYYCDGKTTFEIYVPGCQEHTELYLERTYIHDQGVNCDPEQGQSSSPYINFKLPKFENTSYVIFLNIGMYPIYEGNGTNSNFLYKLSNDEIINNQVFISILFDNGCLHEFTIDIDFKEVRYEYRFFDNQIGACVWDKYCGDQIIGTTTTFARNMNLERSRKCEYSFDCIPPSNNSEEIIRMTNRCHKLKTTVFHFKLIAQNHPDQGAAEAALLHIAIAGANDCDRVKFCSCTLKILSIRRWPGVPTGVYVDDDGCIKITCSLWFDDHKECPGSILYVNPNGDYDISYERCLKIVTIDFVSFLHYEQIGILDTYFPGLSSSDVMDQINSFRNLESHFQACLRFKICLNNKGEYFLLGSNLASLQQSFNNDSNDWINVTHSDGTTSIERYFSQVFREGEDTKFVCPCDVYIPRPESCNGFPSYRFVGFPGNTYYTIFGNAFGLGSSILSAYHSSLDRFLKLRDIENSSDSVIIYPNPSSETSINIVSFQNNFSSIRISSLQGKTIFDLNLSTAKAVQKLNVDISSLPPGTYIVQSKLNSGKLVNNKFVKL